MIRKVGDSFFHSLAADAGRAQRVGYNLIMNDSPEAIND
jgi:hypothetical protein